MTRKVRKIRVACIQNSCGDNWRENLSNLETLVKKALKADSELIAFPENFLWRGSPGDQAMVALEASPKAISQFSRLAKQHKVGFLLGSVLEPSKKRGKFYNTSIYIQPSGLIGAKYKKIHLFDAKLKNITCRESELICAGKTEGSFNYRKIICGMSICYDLRFPELFRRLSLAGARIIFVPSNFTHVTGKAHWEILLRARAIENQVYVVAPAQYGKNPHSGIRSFGHSMIVDPWGTVIASMEEDKSGVIWADLDFDLQDNIREKIPSLKHCKLMS